MNLQTQQQLLARAQALKAAGSTDMAPHALRIAAAHYTDAALLQEELQQHFRLRPLLLALTPDIPAPGSFLARDVIGWPLLLVRGDDGVARTFVNACRHRGARVAGGRGQARSFSCPFHAWNYGSGGHLIARSNSHGGFDAMCAADSNLQALPTRERGGMIFVQLGGEDIDAGLAVLIGPAVDEIASYDIGAQVYFDTRQIVRDCNYKLVVDTFTEAYHIAALHKDSIRPFYFSSPALTDALGAVTRMIGVRSSIEKEWLKPAAEQRLLRHGTTQYILPPNTVLTHQIDHIQLWQVFPVAGDPGRCEVNFHLYWPRSSASDAAELGEEDKRKAAFNVDVIWKVTNEEDFPQCEHAHAALASGALPAVVFGRNEPGGVYYHQQMDAVMAQPATQLVE